MSQSVPISVVIGIYGDKEVWTRKAQRAMTSVVHQTTSQPIHARIVHAETLAQARNQGAEEAEGEWIIFLDADDELDVNYVQAMYDRMKYLSHHRYLLQPATLGVVDGVEDREPVLIPPRDIRTGNFMVIGTMVSRELFLDVGGFQEFRAWEDWELFWRCMDAGAVPVQVPDAIYRVHVNPSGRNARVANDGRLFQEIKRAHRAWRIERGFV